MQVVTISPARDFPSENMPTSERPVTPSEPIEQLLPASPTPPGCDLRGMPYYPLDIVRLFDSDFYALATGDEFRAAVSLWCKAFLQDPAGSLPDDDRILAHLSGAGANWPIVRDMALRGFVKYRDGRLRHPVVVEKVTAAWEARVAQRARTSAATRARAVKREAVANSTSNVTDNVTNAGTFAKSKDKVEVKVGVQEAKITDTSHQLPAVTPADSSGFDPFWAAYPTKRGSKSKAKIAYLKALKEPDVTPESLIAAVHIYPWERREFPRFIPHASTWLNEGRYSTAAEAAAEAADARKQIGAYAPPCREGQLRREAGADRSAGRAVVLAVVTRRFGGLDPE